MELCGFKIIWISNSTLLRHNNDLNRVDQLFLKDSFLSLKITYIVQFF